MPTKNSKGSWKKLSANAVLFLATLLGLIALLLFLTGKLLTDASDWLAKKAAPE